MTVVTAEAATLDAQRRAHQVGRAVTDTATSEPVRQLSRCKCGHDRTHYMVSAEPQYGVWQLLVVSMGISQQPRSIEYRCRRCNEVFDRTDDVRDYVQDDR